MTSSYQLVKRLAAGGMGEVFIARRRGAGSFDKLVALKLMLPHLSEDAARRGRFLNEARLAALMHHPNIVEIFDVGELDGRPFLAMQLIEGVNLSGLRRLLVPDLMSLPLVRFVAVCLCEALSYVHTLVDRSGKPLRLVHRDVSPANLLVSAKGSVFLTDFGIARAGEGEGLTRPGEVHGKAPWVAPEQLSGQPATPASDQYSAALLLYELLCGSQPFRGTPTQPLVPRTVVKPVHALRPEVGPAMSEALTRALSLDPAQRFESMEDFSRAFVDGPVATAPQLGALVRASCSQLLPDFASLADAGEAELTPTDARRRREVGELVFDRYAIVSKLAAGGMGEVFLAQQRGLPGFEREVILKSLLPEREGDAGAVSAFLDEARVLATLNHPNLVSLYDVGTWKGTHFLAMELIRGKDLAALLRDAADEGRAVPPEVAAIIIRDAAAGLHHAHQARDSAGRPLNIIHRDISPQNIMVRLDGLTKVLDFGIARSESRQSGATAPGWIKGKLPYMAPEQLLGSELTASVDQYALGICLWELLTGRRLFQTTAENRFEVVESPRSVRPDLPEALVEVTCRMLEPDAANRFSSCEKVVRALDAWLSQAEIEGHAAVAEYLSTSRDAAAGAKLVVPTAHQLSPTRVRRESRDSLPTAGAREGVPPGPRVRRSAPGQSARELPPTRVMPRGASSPALPEVVTREEARPRKRGVVAGAVGLVVVGAITAAGVFAVRQPSARPPVEPTPAIERPATVAMVQPLAPVPIVPSHEEPSPPDAGAAPSAAVVVQKPRPTRPSVTASGALSIDTRPWSKITVDGESWGSTPIIDRPLAAGHHVVEARVEASGVVKRVEVTISPNETSKLRLDLP